MARNASNNCRNFTKRQLHNVFAAKMNWSQFATGRVVEQNPKLGLDEDRQCRHRKIPARSGWLGGGDVVITDFNKYSYLGTVV